MAKQAALYAILMLACGTAVQPKTGTDTSGTPDAKNTNSDQKSRTPVAANVAGTYPLDLDVVPAVLPGEFQATLTNLTRFMHDPNNAFKPFDAGSAPEGFVKWDAKQMKIVPGGFCKSGDIVCTALGAGAASLVDEYFDKTDRLKIWEGLAKLQTLRLETDLVITSDLRVVGTTRSIGIKDSMSLTISVQFIDTVMTKTATTDRYAAINGNLAFSYSNLVLTAVEQQILPTYLPARFPRSNGTVTLSSFFANLIDCKGSSYCESSKSVLAAVLSSLVWNNTLVDDLQLPLSTTELVFDSAGLHTQLVAQ